MHIKVVGSLLATAIFGTGCTREYRVATLRPQLADQVVVMKGGQRIEVQPFDANRWRGSTTGQLIAADQVESTESRSHGRGVAQGFGLGAVAGLVTGAIVGSIVASAGCHTSRSSGPGAIFDGVGDGLCSGVATLGGIAIGLAGGSIIGGVVGGVRGAKTIHRRSLPTIHVAPSAGGAKAALSWQL